ncbi:DUF393 domain-containing protein [Neobacillus notoginsengisoli]|uniref:DUF393 domain-containing protein n=1 Tax=Neobacillus notoginsengisoli TaxID=1578198 RepID=A0A417YUF7_9BACI|nr:DUF393 domain-containing protein [Neobacillus notoginsengisoli]RHW40824.1 DUF393 domain-containing protein [Neobacillus notoginsengisoli]
MKFVALYDGDCLLCQRSKVKSQKLDWLEKVNWLSLQEYEREGRKPSFEAADLRRELHLLDDCGRVYKGFYAMRKLLLQFPLTIIPALLLYVPFASFIGAPVYRWIAKNRFKWMGKECSNGSCSL